MSQASVAAQNFAKSTEITEESIASFTATQRKSEVATIAQNKSLSNVKVLLNEYNSGMKNCGLSQSDFISSVGESNAVLGNYLASLNGGKVSIFGYTGALIKSKAATIGMRVATAALNVAVSALISIAISKAISRIQDYCNRLEEARAASKEAGDAAKEETDNIQKLYDTYSKAKSVYDSTGDSKDSLDSATQSLVEALGLEEAELDRLIQKYGSLDEAIKQATSDKIKNEMPDLLSGYDAAKEEL